MTCENHTRITEFVLLGFTNNPDMQVSLFVLFLAIYSVTLLGNFLIVTVTSVDPALQTPMYFFLRNLSLLEVCFTLVMVPKMLVDLVSTRKVISFIGCGTQMYFFFFFGSSECFLLSMMAYDRFVAICNPLRYSVIMNRSLCLCMAIGSWMSGVPVSMLQTAWMMALPFCGPNSVDHFFCDGPPVLKLVTEDTTTYEMQALASTLLFIMFPFSLILVSYTRIIGTILRMPSATGRQKAFSTCSSHLIVVSLFYGTASLTYLRPKSNQSPESKKLVSLSYTVITPMLNPIIYSLRNNEVKGAVKRTFTRKVLKKLDAL
ncbi:olfactory receptor 10A7 [Cricetulus griseus]|uniref:Olfactory receptor n=2 Tax=Cricetulus griseus TaxID=10029 RepID=A0A061IG46_CRIGR|nr:olfactory receptor 10A7 [Cricetulus griseus]XP_027247690.1 olfactory receptor 10A7 [Cricetulus griseus]ERE87510.1 olfactory receptor 10A7-like protein [Cricetulus griseus]